MSYQYQYVDCLSVSSELKMVCYYGSWSVYRPGDGKFPVEQIDPFLCRSLFNWFLIDRKLIIWNNSHLIYAFAGLGNDNRIRPLDPYNDLKENYGKGAYLRFNALKNINKNLKTLIAIGGWNEGSIKYSNMASKPETRKIFVESVVQFIERFGFDGLDLDWGQYCLYYRNQTKRKFHLSNQNIRLQEVANLRTNRIWYLFSEIWKKRSHRRDIYSLLPFRPESGILIPRMTSPQFPSKNWPSIYWIQCWHIKLKYPYADI